MLSEKSKNIESSVSQVRLAFSVIPEIFFILKENRWCRCARSGLRPARIGWLLKGQAMDSSLRLPTLFCR